MSEEDLEARLRALEESEGGGKSTRLRRPSPVVASVGIVAISVLGGALYLSLQEESEPNIQTSQPAEFQPSGEGFGTIEPFPEPEPEPEPETEVVVADPNAELLDRIETLQAELEALQNAPPDEVDTSAQDAAMAELTEQIELLREQNENQQDEFARQLAERDRQLAQLQADLDLARLQEPAPRNTGPSEEELRLAELERRRQAAAEFLAARNASSIIAYGGGTSASDAEDGARQLLDAGTDFVRNGAATAEVTQAAIIANPSNTVPQGTLIQAALETAVDSSLPGQVRAITSENVYSYDGTRVLIPRGSRLIGRYSSDVELAQERITVAWDRIILPTDQTVEISALGGDELGRSGVTGDVDNHFAQRFGSAALISLISAGGDYAASQVQDDTGSDTIDSVGGNFQSASANAVNEYLSIPPTITVDQGATITVMVDRDLEIF